MKKITNYSLKIVYNLVMIPVKFDFLITEFLKKQLLLFLIW